MTDFKMPDGTAIPKERLIFAVGVNLKQGEEWVMIDAMQNIRRALMGDQDLDLVFNEHRPLGQLIGDFERQSREVWFSEIINPMNQFLENGSKGEKLDPAVWAAVEARLKSDNPVGQYTALNAVQLFLIEADYPRKKREINIFRYRMHNLVKSYRGMLLCDDSDQVFLSAYEKIKEIIRQSRSYADEKIQILEDLADKNLVFYLADGDIIPLLSEYLLMLSKNNCKLKFCERCGKRFVAKHGNTKLCSPECCTAQSKLHSQEHAERAKNEEKEVAYQKSRRYLYKMCNGVMVRSGATSVKYLAAKARYDAFRAEAIRRKAAVKTNKDFKLFHDWLFAQEREFDAFCRRNE